MFSCFQESRAPSYVTATWEDIHHYSEYSVGNMRPWNWETDTEFVSKHLLLCWKAEQKHIIHFKCAWISEHQSNRINALFGSTGWILSYPLFFCHIHDAKDPFPQKKSITGSSRSVRTSGGRPVQPYPSYRDNIEPVMQDDVQAAFE